MRKLKSFILLTLFASVLTGSCVPNAAVTQGPSSPQAAVTQTPKGMDKARQRASEWVAEASENAPGMETWQGTSVGVPTVYTGSAGRQSILVFPVIKDEEEVGYVTIDVRSGRCTPLESGLGPPPSRNLPEAREMAAETLGTSPDDGSRMSISTALAG